MTYQTKYAALAYTGFHFLKNLGEFDTFEEALDALQEQFEEEVGAENWDSPEDLDAFDEVFWAVSLIEPVKHVIEPETET
jgi:hypothetical protein